MYVRKWHVHALAGECRKWQVAGCNLLIALLYIVSKRVWCHTQQCILFCCFSVSDVGRLRRFPLSNGNGGRAAEAVCEAADRCWCQTHPTGEMDRSLWGALTIYRTALLFNQLSCAENYSWVVRIIRKLCPRLLFMHNEVFVFLLGFWPFIEWRRCSLSIILPECYWMH